MSKDNHNLIYLIIFLSALIVLNNEFSASIMPEIAKIIVSIVLWGLVIFLGKMQLWEYVCYIRNITDETNNKVKEAQERLYATVLEESDKHRNQLSDINQNIRAIADSVPSIHDVTNEILAVSRDIEQFEQRAIKEIKADICSARDININKIEESYKLIIEIEAIAKTLQNKMTSTTVSVSNVETSLANAKNDANNYFNDTLAAIRSIEPSVSKSLSSLKDGIGDSIRDVSNIIKQQDEKLSDIGDIINLNSQSVQNALKSDVAYLSAIIRSTIDNVTLKQTDLIADIQSGVNGNTKKNSISGNTSKEFGNRQERLVDSETGNEIINYYENGNLAKSVMNNTYGVKIYEVVFKNGNVVSSTSFDEKGHPIIEQAFHSNGQVSVRKETLFERNKSKVVVSQFDINGNKI